MQPDFSRKESRLVQDGRNAALPGVAYWTIFSLIVSTAAGLRGIWTWILQVPLVTPDTLGYVEPLIWNSWLPMSHLRTSGAMMFISAGLAIFRQPIGILIVNNILALGAGVLLALAIRKVLHQNVLSLLVLFVVLFTSKDIAFEYFLMSEHYARVLYIVYAALMLWAAANPKHLWLSMIVGLVVALNILVKPDALVLLIATPIGFIAGAWFLSQQRRAFLAATGVFLATTIVPLSAYMSVFQDRFGTFNLSQATGINLFSHIGHLTVLEGGKHPILKERLKPLLGPYAANYAAKGDYQPNWLAFGSVNESLTRDFGSNNPMREIYKYVAESYPSLSQRYTDQVMREIAIEAILHRPGAYLTYATERAIVLWRVGYNFGFYGLPGATFASNHRDDLSTLRIWLYGMIREPVPPCGDVVAAPAKVASSSLVFLFRAPITSCASAPYDDPVAVALMKRADTVYQTIAQPIEAIFPYLPAIGLVSAIAGGFLICFRPNRSSIETYAFSLFLFLVLFGYTAFHGFINVADVSRMTVNVQDYVAIGSLSFLFCVLTFRPAQATS